MIDKQNATKRNNKRNYRKRQRGASIYFLLWAAFSALALVIVLLFAFVMHMMTVQTYKNEAARELSEKGKSRFLRFHFPKRLYPRTVTS